MNKVRVGVLRGGPGSEYEVSLKTGASVLKHLPQEKYIPIDIFIDKEGIWHLGGMPKEPGELIKHIDIVFNALHGESGKVQQILSTTGIPYTGPKPLAAATGRHKVLAKEKFKSAGIKTVPHELFDITKDDEAKINIIFRTLAGPWIIKPVNHGSSIGISFARTYEELIRAIIKALEYSTEIVVETYIKGREATCGIIENFRGSHLYSLLPVEIVPPPEKKFFDYDSKYGTLTQEICPGRFSSGETQEIQELARRAHTTIGARHYSRSDFIVTSQGIYILEINNATDVGLTEESLMPKALSSVGISLSSFLDHVVRQSLS